MGQYYLTANVDKFEFLDPHELGDGLKLMEFGSSSNGTMAALAGMLVLTEAQRGPWAGARIVVCGDYADEGRFVPPSNITENLYSFLRQYEEEPTSTEETGGNVAASAGPKKGPAVVPSCVSAVARAWLGQLASDVDLGVSIRGARTPDAVPPLRAYASDEQVYEQPEDLVDAFQCEMGSPAEVMEAFLWSLRAGRQPSALAQLSVQSSEVKVSARTGKALEWTAVLVSSSNKNSRSIKRSLKFPATSQDVKTWLQVAS